MQLQQERKGTSSGGPLDVAGAKETLTKEVEVRGKPLFCSTENLHCGFLAAGVTSHYSWDPLLFGSSCLFSLVLKELYVLMYLISWSVDDVMKSSF